MLGFGVVFFTSTVVQSSAYERVAGTTAESRALFARGMNVIALQFAYMLPHPHHLDTLAGYVLWRSWGTLPLLIAGWAIVSASNAVRGDEDRQLVDSWLAAGVSRTRLVAYRLMAFALAGLVAALGAAVGTLVGTARYQPIEPPNLAAQTLALWLFMVALFTLCYLVAQIPGSIRGAQTATTTLVLALYLCDVLARTQSSLDWLAWATPFGWYEATYALVPDGHTDSVGMALCVGVTVVGGALSAWAFNRRDVRGPLFARRVREVKGRDVPPSPALSRPVARLLYRQRWVILAWVLGTAGMAVFMVSIARAVVDSLLPLPGMRAFLTHGTNGDPYQAYVGVLWFGVAQLLLAGFAIHTVSGWASDDTEGVLETVLSTPVHRWAVVLERGGMAVIAITLVVAAGSVAAALTASASGITLDSDRVFRASWPLIPFALTFAAAGAVGSAYWPRAAVGVLGILAFVSFLAYEVVPLLGWPDWVENLSVFKLYGTPLMSGIYWNGLWTMVAIVVAGFGLAIVLMQRREVAR
jgi:ABC-2 type transport system permease protein